MNELSVFDCFTADKCIQTMTSDRSTDSPSCLHVYHTLGTRDDVTASLKIAVLFIILLTNVCTILVFASTGLHCVSKNTIHSPKTRHLAAFDRDFNKFFHWQFSEKILCASVIIFSTSPVVYFFLFRTEMKKIEYGIVLMMTTMTKSFLNTLLLSCLDTISDLHLSVLSNSLKLIFSLGTYNLPL